MVRDPASDYFEVLCVGHYEPLKAAVHAALLGVAGVCAAYNAAAWLKRRERHLAVNALVYAATVLWEYRHVQQHVACFPAVSAPRSGLRTAA